MGEYLNTLSPVASNSISQAVLYFKTHRVQDSPLKCDSALVTLKNFAIESAVAINESGLIPKITVDGAITDEDRGKFRKLGLLIKYVDNEPYFIADPQYLLNACENCLSEEMILFMHEFILENREMQQKEELLDLSAKELERRILFWEEFGTEHPDFILADEVYLTYGFYFSQYITGSKTAKAFTGSKTHMQLRDEFRKSYEHLINKYYHTRSGNFVKSYYDFLRQNNFQYNKRVEDYLDSVPIPFSDR